jgi:hypothetical protein
MAAAELAGAQMLSAQTDANGGFGFLGLSESAWQLRPAKAGDLRGAVGAADALYALEAAVGLRALDSEHLAACDATGNGAVGGLDASMLLQYAVESISAIPAAATCGSEWLFFPHPATGSGQVTQPQVGEASCVAGSVAYNPLAGNFGQQDFAAVVLGDCDGSWGAGGGAAEARAAGTRLRLGMARIGRGAVIEIPVYADGGALRAAEMVLRYDAIYLRAHDVRTLKGARGAMLRYNVGQPGRLRIAMARVAAIEAGDQPLLLLRFKIDGDKRSVAVRRAQHTEITRQRVD